MFKLKLSNILAIYVAVAKQLTKFIAQEEKQAAKLRKEKAKLCAKANACTESIAEAKAALEQVNKTLGK